MAGSDEIRKGLWAKMMMAQERAAITRTIGEIMDRKMRGAPIDAAELYECVGGKSEFTRRLFAETFGSESAGVKKGAISSDPAVHTPMSEITEALAKVARGLGEKEIPNATGVSTGVRTVNVEEMRAVFEGDYVCVKVGLTANGGVGPWPDDPFIGGPTTWVFGASTEIR